MSAAAEANPTDSRVLVATGRVLLAEAERTGDRRTVARALAVLERALGGTARRSEGLALYGRALYLSGDPLAAERILQEALSTSPIDQEAFGFLADAAERASHPAVARAALLDLDAIQGDTVSADERGRRARRIGALSLALGDPKAAVRYLTQAVDSAPPDAGTLGLLARAKWQSGDPDGARTALGAAIALSGSDPDLQAARANDQIARGSSASRRASPTKLKPSTSSAIARPGKIVKWGASNKCDRPASSIVPQLGVGG